MYVHCLEDSVNTDPVCFEINILDGVNSCTFCAGFRSNTEHVFKRTLLLIFNEHTREPVRGLRTNGICSNFAETFFEQCSGL